MYRLVDTHAHLDELSNLDMTLEAAKKAGVAAIVAVGSSRQSNSRTMEISRAYSRFIYPALGLHPWELGNMPPSEIDDTLRFIEENIGAAVAVGEVGLDYDKRVLKGASKEAQKKVLGQLLKIAKEYGKPAIIHSRYAWKDSLQMVLEAGLDRAVFHWFTGFSSVTKGIIDSGYFISATPAIEYHQEHRRAIREVPVNRLLLETDCPVTYGRESKYESSPVDVVRTLKAVAQLKELDEAMLAEVTTRNAISLFSLGPVF